MNNEKLIKTCSEKLKSIKSQVVSDDRKEACELLNVSHVTVMRYLKGEVKNIDLGVKMYEFLNNRIERRIEVMSA